MRVGAGVLFSRTRCILRRMTLVTLCREISPQKSPAGEAHRVNVNASGTHETQTQPHSDRQTSFPGTDDFLSFPGSGMSDFELRYLFPRIVPVSAVDLLPSAPSLSLSNLSLPTRATHDLIFRSVPSQSQPFG